jgi:IrrE N-terminal-like domain
MPEFHIDLEWEESPHERTLELNATWARLAMYAGDVPITKVEDHRSGSVRNGIYVPLYPIAEWMVANWWFLWNEWRTDRPDSRHNLLAAREGFALPDLSFLPTETRTQLLWRPKAASQLDRVSFLVEGSRVLSKETVQQELRGFIEAVVQRLDDRGVDGSFLVGEWNAILEAEKDPDQKRFCEQAARLGLDPFDSERHIEDTIEEIETVLPQTVIDDFCDAVTPIQIPSGVKAVKEFMDSVDALPYEGCWPDLRASLQISNGLAPWKYGYEQAHRLRSHLGIKDSIRGELVSFLGNALGSFAVRPFEAPAGIEAMAAPTHTRAPRFGIPNGAIREDSRRFRLCRALSDFLTLDEPSLVTRSQTEHQQRNRAFAAEFLAPAALIRDRIATDRVSEEELEDLAQEFGVSGFVIRHQIENHNLATIVA